MNKLPKEQLQKIIMMAIMAIVVVFVFLNFLIAPIGDKKKDAEKEITSLEKKVKEAKLQMNKTAQLMEQSASALEVIDQVNELIPEGAPIAWFPTRIERHFAGHNIESATPGLVNTGPAPGEGLGSYNLMEWSLNISNVDFLGFAIALAGLENEHPLLEVTSLRINTSAAEPANQIVELQMKNLVRK